MVVVESFAFALKSQKWRLRRRIGNANMDRLGSEQSGLTWILCNARASKIQIEVIDSLNSIVQHQSLPSHTIISTMKLFNNPPSSKSQCSD
jgi:hypothetical protein